MTPAEAVLARARELGIRLTPSGDRIRYAPKSAAPVEFVTLLRAHKAEVLPLLVATETTVVVPAETSGLHAFETWAGNDDERWEKLLNSLKRGWSLGEGVDSPRDIVIRWATARHRLAEAGQGMAKLEERGKPTKPAEVWERGGRAADLSFYSRLADSLAPRAGRALGLDWTARARLLALIANTPKEHQP